DVSHSGDDVLEPLGLLGPTLRVVPEPGAYEGGRQVRLARHCDGAAVAAGAVALASGEDLGVRRVVHHPRHDLAVDLDTDRHGEDGVAVQVVGRAVERVDHPPHAAGALTPAAFLAQDPVFGTPFGQGPDDQRF